MSVINTTKTYFSGLIFLVLVLLSLRGAAQTQYLTGDSGLFAGSVLALESDLFMSASALKSTVKIQPQITLKYDLLDVNQ